MPLRGKPQVAVGIAVLALGAVLLATRFVPISGAPGWLLGLVGRCRTGAALHALVDRGPAGVGWAPAWCS
jgi:hypothetical protein